MEIFIRNVSYSADKNDVKISIAQVLHNDPEYTCLSSVPVNLEVRLFRDKKNRNNHSGSGSLTLPIAALGTKFLAHYGGNDRAGRIIVKGKCIGFAPSNKPLNIDIVHKISNGPYIDPRAAEAKEERVARSEVDRVKIRMIQFGWECRDTVFSCEWERSVPPPSKLSYDDDRREFRIKFGPQSISIRTSQISWTAAAMEGRQSIVCFSLLSPPSFEEDKENVPLNQRQKQRTRISSLDAEHARVVPYASLALRLICSSQLDLDCFRSLVELTNLPKPLRDVFSIEYRGLFSDSILAAYNGWLKRLDFEVSFQIEAIVRKLLVDIQEMLSLRPAIDDLILFHETKYLTALLRRFSENLKDAWGEGQFPASVAQCFERCKKDYVPESASLMSLALEDTFDCLHVSITPTSMRLDGPFPERSNRVFRMYPDHHNCFLRVSFEDENGLQLRFDREVDGVTFVGNRVGGALRDGILVGGKLFRFLAYSQSALKEHAVFFMKPFYLDGRLVGTHTIIESLGNFSTSFDPTLMYCPGRYGARISQAFTSTDSSVSVEAEEILPLADIKRGKWNFTDGVGTISNELAKEIWKALHDKRRKTKRTVTHPRCYQIRFMGCKGMVSVDYRLQGRVVQIRPSMTKFDAPNMNQIEIARAFSYPSPLYLNRPLIMILEGLGVPYEIFKMYQDAAVQEAERSKESLERSARMLESFGLGASYRLPSVMLHLHKLGVKIPQEDFYRHIMEFAINHVFRELKHHARIPIPGWTLVGVVDVHDYLEADEIFACVQAPDTGKKTYLQGRVVVTRSPVIHPGDIRVLKAIGPPPRGSPFEKEPLANSIVFPIKGERPIPSMAGGGDCDGDVFNITQLENLPVKEAYAPAAYTDAPKKLLPEKCTMDDVADFIVDYINSDVLGLIAITWLIIADQSELGIFDTDCLTLGQLHSDAVDYPKSSTPVPLDKIPKYKFKTRPDWNMPETIGGANADYYESQRAIGKLFRAIKLPGIETVQQVSRLQRRQLRQDDEDSLLDRLENMNLANVVTDEIDAAVYERMSEFFERPRIDEDYLPYSSQLFDKYASSLRNICDSHTLSYSRNAMLTEEEVVVGTIVAKSSQPKRRRSLMSQMREQTALLVKSIRNDLAGDDETTLRETLARGWTLWKLCHSEKDTFGARSLGLIALGCIFDTIRAIEDQEYRWL